MIKMPAHKNVIDPPGQIINPIKTLGDYVNSKYGFDLHPYLKTSNVQPKGTEPAASQMPLVLKLRVLADQIKRNDGLRDNAAKDHRTLIEAADAIEAQSPAVGAGLSPSQEPKYTVNGHAIVNRASGEEIPADEPVFIFRARDAHAMYALRDYLTRLPLGTSHHKAVEQRVMDFFDFKAAHPERMKEPDTEPASHVPVQHKENK